MILLLCAFSFLFPPKTELVFLANGFSYTENLYLEPKSRTFYQLGMGKIDPLETRKFSMQQVQKLPFHLRTQVIPDTTVLIFERNTTPNHCHHFFHFLEHLIGLWNFGGEACRENVKLVLFVGNGTRQFEWEGGNQTSIHLVQALFPNAKIAHWKEFIKERRHQLIRFEKVLSSDRAMEVKKEEPYPTERYMGGYFQKLEPKRIDRLSKAVWNYAGEKKELSKKKKVTYVTRSAPRCLAKEEEQTLLEKIGQLEGVELHVVDFAKMPFKEQIQIAANTDVLIGVHGNGLSHALFLPEKATLIELFPPNTFRVEYKIFAELRKLNYFGWEPSTGWNKAKETFGPTVDLPVFGIDIEKIISICLL